MSSVLRWLLGIPAAALAWLLLAGVLTGSGAMDMSERGILESLWVRLLPYAAGAITLRTIVPAAHRWPAAVTWSLMMLATMFAVVRVVREFEQATGRQAPMEGLVYTGVLIMLHLLIEWRDSRVPRISAAPNQGAAGPGT